MMRFAGFVQRFAMPVRQNAESIPRMHAARNVRQHAGLARLLVLHDAMPLISPLGMLQIACPMGDFNRAKVNLSPHAGKSCNYSGRFRHERISL